MEEEEARSNADLSRSFFFHSFLFLLLLGVVLEILMEFMDTEELNEWDKSVDVLWRRCCCCDCDCDCDYEVVSCMFMFNCCRVGVGVVVSIIFFSFE